MAAIVAMAPAGPLSSMNLPSGSSEAIEDIIRNITETNRIRMLECFRDFDPLRSGFVTLTQFFRIVTQTLRMSFSEDQMQYLTSRYGTLKTGRMNYAAFCSTVEKRFNPDLVNTDPSLQTAATREYLGTDRGVYKFSETDEQAMSALLQKMVAFYIYHGINLRNCYEDFDRHHKGVITESQFYRCFPGPPNVSVQEMDLLIKKFADPDKPGLVNYLNLYHDVEALKGSKAKTSVDRFKKTDLSEYLTRQGSDDPTMQDVFDKIRVAVFKNGVRTTEYFKDYDKLRHGVITEHQFICGLMLAVGGISRVPALSRAEVQKVVEYYKTHDNRVCYKEFCDLMENAFNVPNLEKKPTQVMSRPPRGALSRPFIACELSDKETERAGTLLTELSDNVRRRRLMMYQYFKDYDRSHSYTRLVTKSQFGRILTFLSLNVNPEDYKLLCKMFTDKASGAINYPAFVQAVDQEFVGYKIEEVKNIEDSAITMGDSHKSTTTCAPLDITTDEVDLDELLARIRDLVLTKRYRVAEFFDDFDPLNCGSITVSQFRRCLATMSLSKLGAMDLTDVQFDKLSLYYRNPAKQDQVLWKNFMRDIECVFTQPNLERTPTYRVPPQETFLVSKPGTVQWRHAADDHRTIVDGAMTRFRQRIDQRRIQLKPVFNDFDKHNQQHITRNQFKQCLTMLELHCSLAEMESIEAKYCDDIGFNYAKFLEDLEPTPAPQLMYEKRLIELDRINMKKKLPELDPCKNIESLLKKIKIKVCREPIRVVDFMSDYDKLNHGRMLKNVFRRALDLSRLDLTESEMAMLEYYYESPLYPDYVEYRQFGDEIESVFTTKHLEKDPLKEPSQFKLPVEMEANLLSDEAGELLKRCCDRLAERVRVGSIQLFPLFEDFDRVHNGTVTRSQFRRTLSELGLDGLVTDQEFRALYQKFDIKIGGRSNVNYIAFCHYIYATAKFDWTKP